MLLLVCGCNDNVDNKSSIHSLYELISNKLALLITIDDNLITCRLENLSGFPENSALIIDREMENCNLHVTAILIFT